MLSANEKAPNFLGLLFFQKLICVMDGFFFSGKMRAVNNYLIFFRLQSQQKCETIPSEREQLQKKSNKCIKKLEHIKVTHTHILECQNNLTFHFLLFW